jgi:hypothetical protein
MDKHAAARGELEMPREAALELLVALSDEDEDAGIRTEARRTLTQWSDEDLRPLVRRRGCSAEVLRYFLRQDNLRLELLPAVLANRATPQEDVADLAAIADIETVKVLLDNIDRLRTQALIALKGNTSYLTLYENRLTAVDDGFVFEPNLLELLIIEARLEDEREGAVGLTDEEAEEHDKAIAEAEARGDEEKKHQSLYAKIAKMSVSQKVLLALRGGKEERALLIRDSSKVVSRAVLNSPKITDAEIEAFSNAKNVSDEVLRLISMNRKFMRNYGVMKNLVNNPRTPIDVGLPLLNRLIITDVRAVAGNKNISETVRKMAFKLAKQKQN